MKKAVLLILALCLAFSLAACGSSNSVVGKWTGTVEMRDSLVKEVPDIAPYLSSAPVKITMTFTSSGNYSYTFDPKEAISAMKGAMRSYFESYISQMGMTVAEFESAYGDTLDHLIDESLSEEDLADAFSEGGGAYKVDGSKLTLDPGTSDEVSGTYDSAGNKISIYVEGFGQVTLTR